MATDETAPEAALELEYVESPRATDDQIAALHETVALFDKEALPEDPVTPLEETAAGLRHQPDYRKSHSWLCWDQDRQGLLGRSSLRIQYTDENQNAASFWAYVRPEARRRGLGSQLLQPVAELARQEDRTLLSSWTFEGSEGEPFLESLGAESRYRERLNRLWMKEVDRQMLDAWIARAPERASAYELVFWEGPVSDDLLEVFADLAAVMNTAPREDFEEEDEIFTPERMRQNEKSWSDQRLDWWTLVACHRPTGEFAGYTAIFLSPWRSYVAWQGDTGVRPEHRKQGLGRWLKAEMLRRLMKQRPTVDRIDTGNAGSNDPMLKINYELGFRPILTWTAWQIRLDDLEKALHQPPD